MSNAARKEEIVRKFLGSKVFDFNAFGKFVVLHSPGRGSD
ncbi:MAG: hypothetical protein QOD29_1579 [Alphaproteobacteria bacterium]|nr:hypothetical protein [Alphaproteobacteria bacterium]